MIDIIKIIGTWLAYAFIVERITEIITTAKITDPFRNWIFKLAYPKENELSNNYFVIWLHGLISCGYCTSVIIGLFYGSFMSHDFIQTDDNSFFKILNWVMRGLLLHGLSNLIHICFELIRRGRIKSYELSIRL